MRHPIHLKRSVPAFPSRLRWCRKGHRIGRVAPSGRARQCRVTTLLPTTYFPKGNWPDKAPKQDAPIYVLYVAEVATAVQHAAFARGKNLDAGLAKLAQETGIGQSTLRKVADGLRWPNLRTVAQLEIHLRTSTTGWATVRDRWDRGGAALIPVQRPHTRTRTAHADKPVPPAKATRRTRKAQ